MYTQDNGTMVERTPFLLPNMVTDSEFTQEELAADTDGLQMSFQRVKIPAGGVLQFELPGDDPDNPEYGKSLEGVIVYSHNTNAFWPEGSEYDDNTPPVCQSMDGETGCGDPGGICAGCALNRFGSGPKGKGKACKNMRAVYLLRSGEYLPLLLSLPPTSLRPYSDFVNAAFTYRRRGVCGSVVRIGLKKANNGVQDYSVATFQRLYDFTGEELARVRAYADNFRGQVIQMLSRQTANRRAEAACAEPSRPARVMPDNENCFSVGILDGECEELPA